MNHVVKAYFLPLAMVLMALISSAALSSNTLSNISQSAQDNDAFILYKYSMIDANNDSSAEISQRSESDNATYSFNNHTLSCGTKMNGTITRTITDGNTRVIGQFDVNENEYGISQLSFDFLENDQKIRVGAMNINQRTIDINRFDRR